MEEERWRLSTSPNSLNMFLSKRRTSDCHLSYNGRPPLPTYKSLNPALISTSLPSRASHSVTQRRWSAMGAQRDLLPEPVRVSNAYVGVFRHAPCTRGFKDMLWEPSFSTAKPTLTQMDLARQVRFRGRHVDQVELQKLPTKQFKDCTRWRSNQAAAQELDDDFEDLDPAEIMPPNCVICIEGFTPWDEVRELPSCGHVFHKRCIDLWLRGVCSFEACYTRSCPVCKTTLDFSGLEGVDVPFEDELGAEGGGAMEGGGVRRARTAGMGGGGAAGTSNSSRAKSQGVDEEARAQGGFMSRIVESVIPGWAYAQLGSALMYQQDTSMMDNSSDQPCGGGGGRPPCTWAQQ